MTGTEGFGPCSPFFIVRAVKPALGHYIGALGFDCRFATPDEAPFFAIVGRGAAQIFLKAVAEEVGPLPNHERHVWAPWDAFVHVADPEALAAEFADRGVAVKQPLGLRDDGLRGFEVADPDGYVCFFGRPD